MKISIVMPVYNAEHFLKEAIGSILGQSFSDFEFIIVNDGSSDESGNIVKSFNDKRIVYIGNTANSGLAHSINTGVQAARGLYIARMDADDIALPHRLEEEAKYLDTHPAIGVVGSWMVFMNESGNLSHVLKRPATPLGVKWQSLFSTPLFHPAIMARSEILKQNPYDENLHNSEDYELWSRLLFKQGVQLANIEKPLLYYRSFDKSFTRSLDKSKRAASALNTIHNISHYTSLHVREAELVTLMRESETLSAMNLFAIWKIYVRAAKAFIAIEKPSPRDERAIYKSLISFSWSLKKYWLKHLIQVRQSS